MCFSLAPQEIGLKLALHLNLRMLKYHHSFLQRHVALFCSNKLSSFSSGPGVNSMLSPSSYVANLYENMMLIFEHDVNSIPLDFFCSDRGRVLLKLQRLEKISLQDQLNAALTTPGKSFRLISFPFSFAFSGNRNNPNMEEFFYLC